MAILGAMVLLQRHIKRSPEIGDLNRVQLPSDPTMSPDGRYAVYTIRTVNRVTDAHEHQLWMLDSATGESSRLTDGPADIAPRWSPDSKALAFLRTFDGIAQLYIVDPTSRADPIVATSLQLGAGTPVWSPDGTKIAFCAPVDPDSLEGEGRAARAARLDKGPVVIRGLGYKSDGSSQSANVRSQLHVLEVSTLCCRALTNTVWDIRTAGWHPDGQSLIIVGSGETDADRQDTRSVYQVDVNADRTKCPEFFSLSGGYAITAQWARSGNCVLVVGREKVSAGHFNLIELDVDTGLPNVNLSAGLDRNLVLGGAGYPGALPQQGADQTVFFCARDSGATQLFSVTLGKPDTVKHVFGTALEVVAGMSISGDRAAVVTVTPSSYGQVSIVELSTGAVLARSGHGLDALADIDFIEPVARKFILENGTSVHGWVLRHPSARGATPLLLDIHGGPHNSWSGALDDTHLYHQVLVAHGWTVLMLNPPSSDGYGEEFFTANIGKWGYGDQDAFLDPLDALIDEGVADPKRLAVAGYSYGGFSTCWLTSHTDRFAAAVVGGLICDTTSFVTSDEGCPEMLRELGATPWDDRETLLAQSPYVSVSAVNTPTLILHGGEDQRCPVNQAEQWFVALRAQGVATELVLYPGESHLFVIDGRPSHRVDYAERLVGWLNQFINREARN